MVGEGMKVSVIVPTRNGGKYLERLCKTLRAQSFKEVQIVVVDSCSDDDTLKICRDFGADLIQIDATTFDHGGTRNLAASKTEGEILVFMTQDALLKDTTSLESLLSPLEDITVAASYGRQIPKDGGNPVEIFIKSFNYPPMGMIKGIDDLPRLGIKTFFLSNACSAIKKKAFEEVGGFPEKTIMNEDMFLAAKLLMKGYKVAYQPDALVYHSHNYSVRTQFKRYFDIGVFFNRNQWIRNMARTETEGVKYLKEVLRFLFDSRQLRWIPYALIDATTRFLGYRIGLLEGTLPLWLKKRISYNKNFWNGKMSSFIDRGNSRC
jgi:rhamnosyltransferase